MVTKEVPGMKRCGKCKRMKLLVDFQRDSCRKSGYRVYCRMCSSMLAEVNRRKHPNRRAESDARRLLTHPESAEADKQYQKEYRETHREDHRRAVRRWEEEHPEERRVAARRQRAQRRNLNEHFTKRMEAFVRSFFQDRCAVCGEADRGIDKRFPIDHWRPLSRGFVLSMDNAVLMCGKCNSSKGGRWPKDIYHTSVVNRIEELLQTQQQSYPSRQSKNRVVA